MFKLPFLKAKYLQPRFLMVIFFVIIVGFSFAGVANAGGISDAVATFLGWIVYGIVYALGWVLTLVMQGLIWLAQWNNFINAPAVVLGWKIVRDICNMFFVVIMLIIAFATILRVKDYTYEKLLPKLIIMAILINFSKMICGLLIDVSQVVMLTFVNSFKDVGGENLTKILGLDTLTSMQEGGAEEANITAWSIMGSYVLALVYVIVALITIITMMIMLAVRIVMIWIYVVLSPLAYLLGAFPAGKKYSGEWWGEFTKNLIVGPVLAFFIWLSFAALGTGQDSVGSSGINADKPSAKGISSEGSNSITQAGSPDNMLNFVISIAMLFGGLKVAKSIGGAAGGMANKGIGAINKGLVKPMAAGAAGAYAFSKRKAIAGAVGAGRIAKTGLGGLDRTVGSAISNLGRKDGKIKKYMPNFGDKGLIGTTAGFVMASPGKIVNSMKTKINKNKDLRDKLLEFNSRRDREGDNAILDHEGKKYKLNKENKFYEVDDKGVGKNGGSRDGGGNLLSTNNELRDKLLDFENRYKTEGNNALLEYEGKKYKKNKNNKFYEVDEKGVGKNGGSFENGKGNLLSTDKIKDVKKINNLFAGTWQDAWKDNNSKASSAANKAQEKKISEKQQEFADSNLSTEEMVKRLSNASTSSTEKMALAMTLAIKGGFKTKEDFSKAKNAVANNYVLSKKFNDEVDKNQAHLAYNFDKSSDVAKFKKRIDTGKINDSNLQAEAYEIPKLLQAMEDHHGELEFDRIMNTVARRGTKYTKSLSKGSLENRRVDSAGSITNPASAVLHAKVTGDINQSFKTTLGIDQKALSKYLTQAGAANFNSIDKNEMKKLLDSNTEIKELVLNKLTSGKLKSMYRLGNNDELVEYLVKEQRDRIDEQGKKIIEAINKDPELGQIA